MPYTGFHEEVFDLFGVGLDLSVVTVRALSSEFEAVEGALARKWFAFILGLMSLFSEHVGAATIHCQ